MPRNNGNDKRRAQQSKRRRPANGGMFPYGDGSRAFDPAAVRRNQARRERRAA